MNIQTEIPNAGLYLILFVALAAGFTYLVYHFRKFKDEFSKSQTYLLSGIKFSYMVLLFVLMLSPIIETIKERIDKPLLIVGVDNSESISADSSNISFISDFTKDIKRELDGQFQLEILRFGEQVQRDETFTFTDKASNYSTFFSELEKRYYNLNVGAILIIGDGIYNEGKNPEQIVGSIHTPVYSIGLGDTLSKSDQAIIDVSNNPNVFLGNSFPVEIETNFTDFNFPSTQLTITIDGKIEHSEQIEIPQANYFLKRSITLKAEEPGLKTITVSLSPFLDEQNKQNNQKQITIEVHNNKNDILILSQGPHPDIGAITETLKRQANYNIKFSEITLFSGNIEDYDLVIFNQLPSVRTQNSDIYKRVIEKKIPLFIIIGPNTSASALNNLNVDFSLQPSLLKDDSNPHFNPSFALFNLPATIKEVENIYPPLLTFHTEYNFSSDYSVIAFQKINGIEMNLPLILVGETDDRKVGIITGEGIWRWRFQEFQNYNNQNNFNQLIVSLFDYLCLKEVREQFKIEYKRIVNESTPVEFKAQVFNELYQPITTAEVAFILTDSTGNVFKYLFSPNEINYNLNLGFLSPGKYSFVSSTKIGESDFTKSGEFVVQELNVEQQNLQAKFQTLNYISKATNGEFGKKSNANEIIEKLKNNRNIKTAVTKEKSIADLIDFKWYVAILLFLLSLEWFLRKFWGSY